MAQKSESDKADAAGVVKTPAHKKLLVFILGLVLVLGALGVGAIFYIKQQHAATLEETENAEENVRDVVYDVAKTPPVYLPLDSMVVNLADPGGERVAQIGITLEMLDAQAAEHVRAFLPTIRSAILMLASQRTADELLTQAGKEKLAQDVLVEALRPFKKENGRAEKMRGVKKHDKNKQSASPVLRVLFASFIIQ